MLSLCAPRTPNKRTWNPSWLVSRPAFCKSPECCGWTRNTLDSGCCLVKSCCRIDSLGNFDSVGALYLALSTLTLLVPHLALVALALAALALALALLPAWLAPRVFEHATAEEIEQIWILQIYTLTDEECLLSWIHNPARLWRITCFESWHEIIWQFTCFGSLPAYVFHLPLLMHVMFFSPVKFGLIPIIPSK